MPAYTSSSYEFHTWKMKHMYSMFRVCLKDCLKIIVIFNAMYTCLSKTRLLYKKIWSRYRNPIQKLNEVIGSSRWWRHPPWFKFPHLQIKQTTLQELNYLKLILKKILKKFQSFFSLITPIFLLINQF